MKTEIFKTYAEFLSRTDKKINGVSESFAQDNPTFVSMNETNKACWNCSSCSYCSYCSYCSDCSSCSSCSYCSYCSDCSSCSSCSSCSYCSYCSDCSSCSYCSDCSSCSYCSYCRIKENIKGEENKENDSPLKNIPVIENIHQKIYNAVTKSPSHFDMESWHNKEASCGTTHCRAGWVIHLAGEQGYALERHTSPTFAALQIYKASSPDLRVSPYRFHESNEMALANMKEYAEKEAELNK